MNIARLGAYVKGNANPIFPKPPLEAGLQWKVSYLFFLDNLGDAKGKVFTALPRQTACLYFLRFWIFLGECLGRLALEEVQVALVVGRLLLGLQDGGAFVADLEVAVSALDFTQNGNFLTLALLFAFLGLGGLFGGGSFLVLGEGTKGEKG